MGARVGGCPSPSQLASSLLVRGCLSPSQLASSLVVRGCLSPSQLVSSLVVRGCLSPSQLASSLVVRGCPSALHHSWPPRCSALVCWPHFIRFILSGGVNLSAGLGTLRSGLVWEERGANFWNSPKEGSFVIVARVVNARAVPLGFT